MGCLYILLFSFASKFFIRITRKAIGCWNLLREKTKKKKKCGEIVLEAVRLMMYN